MFRQVLSLLFELYLSDRSNEPINAVQNVDEVDEFDEDDNWMDVDQGENTNLENDENFFDYVVNNNSIIDNWESINENDINSFQKEKIYLLMKKCRLIINITKKSTILLNYFNQLQTKFSVKRGMNGDCITRWNSTFLMIDSLIILKPLIIKFFDDKYRMNLRREIVTKLISIELEHDDWQLMVDISTVLKPFYLATKLMSARSYPTIGLCYYVIRNLYIFLLNDEHGSTEIKTLKYMLLTKFQKYFVSDHEQLKLLKVSMMKELSAYITSSTSLYHITLTVFYVV